MKAYSDKTNKTIIAILLNHFSSSIKPTRTLIVKSVNNTLTTVGTATDKTKPIIKSVSSKIIVDKKKRPQRH